MVANVIELISVLRNTNHRLKELDCEQPGVSDAADDLLLLVDPELTGFSQLTRRNFEMTLSLLRCRHSQTR